MSLFGNNLATRRRIKKADCLARHARLFMMALAITDQPDRHPSTLPLEELFLASLEEYEREMAE